MDDEERLPVEMACKPCLHCLEEKPAAFKMIRNNELDYFCSKQCASDFKAASSLCDVLKITIKRTTIVRYPLACRPQDCVSCEKKESACQ